MARTADYGLVPYRPMMLQYSDILAFYLILNTAVYGALTVVVLRSMCGLCCDETYGTMTNYNDGDGNGNEDRNVDDNAASGSNGPILSRCLGFAEEDRATTATALRRRCTIYLRVALYIYPIKTLLKMCHKLLYAEFGGLDWCRCHIKKENLSLIHKRLDYIFEIYNESPLIA